MSLRLYNTMTRSVEPFVPIDPPRVSLYTCGPTVYNFAHIGNFRTFLFEDLLRRWLDATGYEVFHVMNLTDVDDKTINGASARGEQLRGYVQQYIDAFYRDCHYLRIRDASEYPVATEAIGPMIELVTTLLDKGVAYRSEDGSVYFAIDRFPAYGKLSRLDRRELRVGASQRVSADEYAKEDARDFVLWKAARPEDEAVGAAWDAPFGRGRPGWHLECSAMALDALRRHGAGEVLDIHAGGVDLVFPHHEDEIAQSCAFTGQPQFARVWMHGEFLTISGSKMAKRVGNVLTAFDLREEGVDAGAVRLLVFNSHYRQRLDWSDEALGHAREGSRRLGEAAARVRAAAGEEDDADFAAASALAAEKFRSAMDDDLSSPRALAALFDFARESNRLLDAGGTAGPVAVAVFQLAADVLDVFPDQLAVEIVEAVAPEELSESAPSDSSQAASWARGWAERRQQARLARDYAESDRIRDVLAEAGFDVRDSADGYSLRRR